MRNAIIQEIGPYYRSILSLGDEQRMVFNENDDGPFYLSNNHRFNRKYDQQKGRKKVVTKSKKDLKIELKTKGHFVRGHCGREEIEDIARKFDIELTTEIDVVEEGWLGKPKGLLQILCKRG